MREQREMLRMVGRKENDQQKIMVIGAVPAVGCGTFLCHNVCQPVIQRRFMEVQNSTFSRIRLVAWARNIPDLTIEE